MPVAPMRVLVTDAEQRAALAVVRALGRAGYAPYVCSTRGHALAGASRFAQDRAEVPDPLGAPAAFVAALRRLIDSWEIAAIIPIAEPALLAVLESRDEFPGVLIPFPDLTAFRRICDKAEVLRIATEVGLAVPQQHALACSAAADALDLDTLGFPIVLKPARSLAEGAEGRVRLGVLHAVDRRQLGKHLQDLPPAAFPLLLQRRIVGPGIGVFVLLWDGQVRAAFAHRRLREKPPAGGVSVYRESYPLDPELLRLSVELLSRFSWQGVAMVEFKVEATTGRPYLMEVNGRFWGSLQLAIDAGVDFPVLLMEAATGAVAGTPPAYRLGARSRWWWGDVDQLLTRLRHSPAELSLPPDAPSLWRSILQFLAVWRPGDRNEVFRWRDPGPFFRETVDWLARR